MTDVIIPGSMGRIEARYQVQNSPDAPVALILHPHPLYGGTMNNKVTYMLYHTFFRKGFHVCRFNFRGIGKSSGTFDNGEGELSDAATVLDWLRARHPNAAHYWVAGFSFGAWITMQLLMRRPEIEGFVCVAPPTNKYDFNFLAPCPVSGQILQGTADEIVDPSTVEGLVNKLSKQKNIQINLELIENANHFFPDHIQNLSERVFAYLEQRLAV